MAEDLEARLRAVERALVEGEPPASLATAGELATRLERVEARLDDLDERVLALEAATRALAGQVGSVTHVNRAVERRAEAALAAVEGLEARGSDGDRARPADHHGADRAGGSRSRRPRWETGGAGDR